MVHLNGNVGFRTAVRQIHNEEGCGHIAASTTDRARNIEVGHTSIGAPIWVIRITYYVDWSIKALVCGICERILRQNVGVVSVTNLVIAAESSIRATGWAKHQGAAIGPTIVSRPLTSIELVHRESFSRLNHGNLNDWRNKRFFSKAITISSCRCAAAAIGAFISRERARQVALFALLPKTSIGVF